MALRALLKVKIGTNPNALLVKQFELKSFKKHPIVL